MSKVNKNIKLLKVSQVAERCGVKPRTVARWIREGRLPAVKMNNSTWRIDERDLRAFIENQPVGPT